MNKDIEFINFLEKVDNEDDLKSIDINEESWQRAREKAWDSFGQQYFLKVSSSV